LKKLIKNKNSVKIQENRNGITIIVYYFLTAHLLIGGIIYNISWLKCGL